jgi:hypothetical protein
MQGFLFFNRMNKKIAIALLVTIIIALILQWQGASLRTAVSEHGIVDYELARTKSAADTISNATGKTPLRINITIDFLFIVAYGLFFYLSCKALMNHFRSSGMKTLGFIFMELGVLAAVLDLCENIGMLITLSVHGSDISTGITHWVCIGKFAIAALVLAYIIISFAITRYTKE